MIESVTLQNWKTHSNSSFEFGKGTNVLVGAMGSGKTSVMDGICFALFGTFPSLQARRLSLEEVIMSKPEKAEEALVELAFSYAGKSYRVERRIKKKGSSEARIWCDGTVIAGPKPRDVNNAVEKAIEVNYNLFSRAVYSEQNEIDYFLRLSPRDRKAKFDELLDLQRYETVRANAVTALNRLKSMAKDKRQWVEEQKASLSAEDEKALVRRIGEKEKENEKLKLAAAERQKEEGGMEKVVKGLEEKEALFRKLKEGIAKNRAVVTELKNSVEETKKEAGEKSLPVIEKEKQGLSKEKDLLAKRLAAAQKMQEKELERKSEFGKISALNQKKAEELNKHLQELQGIGAQCPLCKQKLEAKTREQLLQETMEGVKKAASTMEQALKNEAATNAKIAKLKEEERGAFGKLEELRERETKVGGLLDSLKKLAEKERKLTALLVETEKSEKKLKLLGFDEARLLACRKKEVELRALVESTKKSIEANQLLVREMRARLEAIEKARKQISEEEKRIKGIERIVEKMNYFINSLLAAQSELRENLISTINEAMHDIWQRIYPYRDFVSAKMDVAGGSYELRVKERSGNWVRVEGILSGGERSAAAICIRISFSLVLAQNLGWLVLDEPTHNLDVRAVETLASMMQLHLPSLVQQIFVITHDRQMEKAASASLYVLQREKDRDAVTKPVLVQMQA